MVRIDASVALTAPNSLEKVGDRRRRQCLGSEVSLSGNQGADGGRCLGIRCFNDGHVVSSDVTFAQRSSHMRASVVNCTACAVHMEQGNVRMLAHPKKLPKTNSHVA